MVEFSKVSGLSVNDLVCNVVVAVAFNWGHELLVGDSSGSVLLRTSCPLDYTPQTVLVLKNASIVCHFGKLKIGIGPETVLKTAADSFKIRPNLSNNISQVDYTLD